MVSWGGENREELLAKLYEELSASQDALSSELAGPAPCTRKQLETTLRAADWKTDPIDILLGKLDALTIGEIKHVLQVMREKRDARTPKSVLSNDKCVVCWAERYSLCARCEQWAVCKTCCDDLEGNCLQCLFKDQKDKAEQRMKTRPAFETV